MGIELKPDVASTISAVNSSNTKISVTPSVTKDVDSSGVVISCQDVPVSEKSNELNDVAEDMNQVIDKKPPSLEETSIEVVETEQHGSCDNKDNHEDDDKDNDNKDNHEGDDNDNDTKDNHEGDDKDNDDKDNHEDDDKDNDDKDNHENDDKDNEGKNDGDDNKRVDNDVRDMEVDGISGEDSKAVEPMEVAA